MQLKMQTQHIKIYKHQKILELLIKWFLGTPLEQKTHAHTYMLTHITVMLVNLGLKSYANLLL